MVINNGVFVSGTNLVLIIQNIKCTAAERAGFIENERDGAA